MTVVLEQKRLDDVPEQGLPRWEVALVERAITRLPRVVVFDLDGTLVQSEHQYISEMGLLALEAIGAPLPSRDEWHECVRRGQPLAYLSKRDQDRWEAPFWDALNYIERPEPSLLPGTLEALDTLRELGCESAIFTARYVPSSRDPHFEEELKRLGILPFISAHEGRRLLSISSRGSDKSVQLRALCEALQIPASEMMIVGDSPCDIEAGRRCNALCTVLVRSGGLCESVACRLGADLICDSVLDCALLLDEQFGNRARLRLAG